MPVQKVRNTEQRTKERKLTSLIPNSPRQPTKGRKEVIPLGLSTDRASLETYLQVRKEANSKTSSDVSAANLQHTPAIGVIYGLNQSTGQKFDNQATCISQEHREPHCLLLSIKSSYYGVMYDPIREKNRQKIALLPFDAQFGTQEVDRFCQSLAKI